MTRKDVILGLVYEHNFLGRIWKVRVTGLDKQYPNEWNGLLVGSQGGVEDGAKVWGLITDLQMVKQ